MKGVAMTDKPIPFRVPADQDIIPTKVVLGMFSLTALALMLVAWAKLTGQPVVAVPPMAEVVSSRTLILSGGDAQAVKVFTPEGRLLADLPHGGFITVIQNGLQRERLKYGISADKPINIVTYANGRLAAEDPLTGWDVELGIFGADNRAAFEKLLAME